MSRRAELARYGDSMRRRLFTTFLSIARYAASPLPPVAFEALQGMWLQTVAVARAMSADENDFAQATAANLYRVRKPVGSGVDINARSEFGTVRSAASAA
jgi:hypothetical protein